MEYSTAMKITYDKMDGSHQHNAEGKPPGTK